METTRVIHTTIDRGAHRILVVDDHPTTRYSTARTLRAAGFATEEAASGGQALALAAQGMSALVLDVHLPDVYGFEVCRLLREDPRTASLPVIHLSATFVQDRDKVAGLNAGADAYLVHPAEPAVLVATLQALIRARSAEDRLRQSESRFRAIYNQVPDGMALLDAAGRLDDVNPALATQLGRAPEALIGQQLAALAVPGAAAQVQAFVAQAAAAQGGSGFLGYIASLPLLGKVLFGTFLVSVVGIPIWAWSVGNRAEFQMMSVAIILVVFNVVFWTLFEQAGSSLTFFADRNTDRQTVFGLMPAGSVQVFNPIFIVMFAPIMSLLWTGLARRGLEPSIPVKFAVALMGAGLGFVVLVWGTGFAGDDYKVALWWVAATYLIHSIAELCISPVGLSMITKLSIARIVGMMMGVWFLSIACAQYVAGVVAQFASVETVGGRVTNLKVSLDTYAQVFQTIGLISLGIGVVLLLLSPLIKKWMHGVQ